MKYLKSEKHGVMPVYDDAGEAQARAAGFTEECGPGGASLKPAETEPQDAPKKRGRPKKAE